MNSAFAQPNFRMVYQAMNASQTEKTGNGDQETTLGGDQRLADPG